MSAFLQELLAWHVAYLVLIGLDDRVRLEWLNRAVLRLPESSEIEFYHRVGQSLGDQDPATRDAHWQTWLGAFWKTRVDGIPRPLSPRTSGALAGWVVHVGRFFPDAVRLVLRMDSTCLVGRWGLLRQLSEKGLIRDHPEPAAELTIRYPGQPGSHGLPADQLDKSYQEFRGRPLPAETRARLDDAMFRAGYTTNA